MRTENENVIDCYFSRIIITLFYFIKTHTHILHVFNNVLEIIMKKIKNEAETIGSMNLNTLTHTNTNKIWNTRNQKKTWQWRRKFERYRHAMHIHTHTHRVLMPTTRDIGPKNQLMNKTYMHLKQQQVTVTSTTTTTTMVNFFFEVTFLRCLESFSHFVYNIIILYKEFSLF